MSPDFALTNHGSLWGVTPKTPRARKWLSENVAAEPWSYMGSTLFVEPRYIENLAAGWAIDGLTP